MTKRKNSRKTNQSGKRANRKYKDSVFTKLFGEKNTLLELYSAISRKNYPENTKIEIITLSDTLYMDQLNDICFTIDGKLVVLIEHQSTINENMPLRALQYLAREYECITERKDLYREKLIKIPTPELIVLYNGKDKFPDYKELRLSDSFELRSEPFYLELVVKAYNINKGFNPDMADRSPTLSGYEEFISVIRDNLKSMNLRDAIRVAIRDCISRNILVYFLKRHGSEVENMLLTEWNWDDAKSVWQEEAREEGWEQGVIEGDKAGFGRGREEGRSEGREELFALWESGVSLTEAKQKFGLL